MQKTVWQVKVPEYDATKVQAAVEKLFSVLPAAQRLGPGMKVLLKPNLLARHTPERAVTTHPEVLRAVIRACEMRGVAPGQITVAGSCGGLYNGPTMKSVYQASGLWAVCREEGVECYTACRYSAVAAHDGKLVHEYNLIDPVREADFIIDLPKLKTHVMTGYTGAIKNLFGCIPGLQKAELHMRFPEKEKFGQMLVDLYQTVKPDMAIMDGILAHEGDGPAGGEPRQVGLLLASEDLFNLDLAGCALIGLDPMRVPYLLAGNRSGLCGAAFDPKELGGQIKGFGPIEGFKLPGSYTGGGKGANFSFSTKRWIPGFAKEWVKALEKKLAPHPVIDQNKCIGCGKCAEICPGHTIRVDKKATIDPEGCIRCFCCHEMCPVKAIDVKKYSLFRL